MKNSKRKTLEDRAREIRRKLAYTFGGIENEEFSDLQAELKEIDKKLEDLDQLKPRKWSEINALSFPQDRWLVQDLIPREGIVILASVAGESKTWIAMEIAKCIASGKDFLGKFKTGRGNVLYVDAELAVSEFQRRGRQLHFEEAGDGLSILTGMTLNLNKPEEAVDQDDIDKLFAYVRENKITAIFIDTFRAVAGGLKEEKAEEVRRFFNQFKELKDEGIVLIFLDHRRKSQAFEGKAPKKEQLFSSMDKVAIAEVLLMTRTDEETKLVQLYQRKNRLGAEIEPFGIAIDDVVDADMNKERTTLTYTGPIEDKESKKDEARVLIPILLKDEGKTRQEIITQAFAQRKIGEKNTSEALRELEEGGRIGMKKQGKKNFYFILGPNDSENMTNSPDLGS